MKLAIIIYHKNILSYPGKHILACLKSILSQTYNKFDIIELNYDSSNKFSLLHKINYKKDNHTFIKKECDDHIDAFNFLLNYCFVKKDYQMIFNVNLDDEYFPQKIEKQMKISKEFNYDLITSNYLLDNDKKEIIKTDDYIEQKTLIKNKLSRNLMIIQMSGACITKNFFKKNGYLTEHQPFENLFYCKKGIKNKSTMFIIPEILMKQNIHSNMLTYKFR